MTRHPLKITSKSHVKFKLEIVLPTIKKRKGLSLRIREKKYNMNKVEVNWSYNGTEFNRKHNQGFLTTFKSDLEIELIQSGGLGRWGNDHYSLQEKKVRVLVTKKTVRQRKRRKRGHPFSRKNQDCPLLKWPTVTCSPGEGGGRLGHKKGSPVRCGHNLSHNPTSGWANPSVYGIKQGNTMRECRVRRYENGMRRWSS